MKKIFNWTLSSLLLIILIACGGSSSGDSNPTDSLITSEANSTITLEKEVSITTTQDYKTGYFTNFYHQNGNNLFEEADGTLHLAFVENYELFYALSKDAGKTWSKEKIPTGQDGGLRRASLTVDSNGKVFIGFTSQDKFNYANPTNVVYGQEFEYDLSCVTNISGTWLIETLYTYQSRNNSQEIASINVDKENNIYIFANYYGWWSNGGTAYEYIRSASNNTWSSGIEIVKYSDTVVDKGIYGYFSSHITSNGDITLTMMRHRANGGVDDKLFYVKKKNGAWQTAVEIDSPNRTNARTYHFDTAMDKSNRLYLAYIKNDSSGVPQVLFSTNFSEVTAIYTGTSGDIIHSIKLHSDAGGNLLLLVNNDTKKATILEKDVSSTTWVSSELETEVTAGVISEVSSVQTNSANGDFSNFKMTYFGKLKALSGDGSHEGNKLYFYNHAKKTSTPSSDTTPVNSSTKTILIGHQGGIDFSEDNNFSVGDKQDGYAVVWSPTTYVEGEEWGKGVWFNVNVSDATNTYIYIQSLGDVSLDSVTSIDTTAWHLASNALKSLEENNVYVVKTKDGYAKFKVLSIDFISDNWNFTAEYKYSSTRNF